MEGFFIQAAILGLQRSPFIYSCLGDEGGRGIATFCPVLKSCADPDSLLLLTLEMLSDNYDSPASVLSFDILDIG